MPTISSCPECHRDLTIPDLADRQQPLRCPLCDAQFPAECVLADSVSFPPAAIVVGADAVAQAPMQAPGDAWSEPASDTIDDLATPHLQVSAAPAVAEQIEINPPSGDEEIETYTRSEPIGAIGPIDESPGDAGRSPTEFESFGQQAATMRVAAQVRKKSSPFGVLGQLLGMVVGGVLGLAIGYYVLVWIGGPRADFLELRGKVPHWLKPPVRRHNSSGATAPFSSQQKIRSGQPERSMGDLLNEPDPMDEKQGVLESAAGILSESRAAEAEQGSVAGRSPTTADAPTVSPRQAKLVERLPPGPKPLPAGYFGPRAFKRRTAAELATALEETEHALRCPYCQGPGAVRLAAFDDLRAASEGDVNAADAVPSRRCDYCRGKPMLNLSTAAFEQICDLAETITFVQFESDDASPDRCREAAESILMAIGGQRDKSEIVGRLAAARLDDSQRPSNGIVLAGTVQQAQPEGDLFVIKLLLVGSGRPVTVIGREPPDPPVTARDHLLVLGSIVDSPRDNLAGYGGDRPQVVWGGLPLKLAAPAR